MSDGPPLVFRGPPGRLASLLPDGFAAGAGREASATLNGVAAPRLAVRPLARGSDVSASRATLRLPTTTPPGSYRGVARIGGREHPITVEV